MAHERETWLNHGVAELLLRGRPVETADEHAQAQADRLARVLAEAARVASPSPNEGDGGGDSEGRDTGAGAAAASGELPGEAAALAAFRQAVGTGGAGRAVSRNRVTDTAGSTADTDGIGTVRLVPEQRRRVRLPSFGRPIRLGLAAAMAGCALSGVAAGAGYLYAPSAGESSPRPANSVSGAVTPEPLVSDSPSTGVSRPPPPGEPSGGDGAGSVVPGATGTHPTAGTAGDGGPKGDKGKGDKGQASGNGWKGGNGEKWYARLVQACHEYRDGTIAGGKKKLLEDVAKGPAGVTRFCDELLSGGSGGDGHYEGAPGHGHGDDGGSTGGGDGGSGGGDGPQNGGPDDGGGSDGGTDGGGGDGGTDGGGTGGGSGEPSTGWPGGDYGETIGMDPDPEGANLPPLLPVTPDAGTDSGADIGTGSDAGSGPGTDQAAP
ncbi:hypothetical protein GCM10011583_25270 [Streptomyces camponoticapitis]|uniref:Extensin n=1 Tax=Streptomyces camponoticapitis TaxID=1616125 RepID=A0ABQ2E3I0_9ACTN|nr:hypothetical protein [Streptomyces camponoticapitis]GGJ92817.1 hypothetical protein GCM10011583_25270 [Streptomyces camponoticapitis]